MCVLEEWHSKKTQLLSRRKR